MENPFRLINKKEVWIYDPQNGFARTQGPSLTTRRHLHSCSTMKDGKKTVIVTAGGRELDNGNPRYLDSVEIYDPTDNTWHSGKNKYNKSIFMSSTATKKLLDIKRKTHNLIFSTFLYYRSIFTLLSRE